MLLQLRRQLMSKMIVQRLSHHLASSPGQVDSSSSSSSSSSCCFDLKGYRSLVSVKGPDAGLFLQGLITNDINRLTWPNTSVIYAMMLNQRGRTLFDTLVYNLNPQTTSPAKELEPANYLLEVDAKQREQALRYFKTYKLRKKVDLALVDDQFGLFSLFGQAGQLKVPEAKPLILQDDPRWEQLGKRLLVKSDNAQAVRLANRQVDLEAYKSHLYRHGVPENNDDFKFEASIPLEYNLVFMNGVQFDKGCYLGQELVAKTHHTGVIRKRVMPLRLLDPSAGAEFESNAEVLNTKTNRSAGKLINLSAAGGFGIGLLRLENLDPEALVLVDKAQRQHAIRVTIPGFWKKDSVVTDQLMATYSS